MPRGFHPFSDSFSTEDYRKKREKEENTEREGESKIKGGYTKGIYFEKERNGIKTQETGGQTQTQIHGHNNRVGHICTEENTKKTSLLFMSSSPLPSSRAAIATPPLGHTPTPPGPLSLPSFEQAFGTAGTAAQNTDRERDFREYDYYEPHDSHHHHRARGATTGGGGGAGGGRLPPIQVQNQAQTQVQRATRFDTRIPRYDSNPQHLPPLKRDSRKRAHADRDDSSEYVSFFVYLFLSFGIYFVIRLLLFASNKTFLWIWIFLHLNQSFSGSSDIVVHRLRWQ